MIMIHGGRDHCRNWECLNAPMPEKIHVWMDELRNLPGRQVWFSCAQ